MVARTISSIHAGVSPKVFPRGQLLFQGRAEAHLPLQRQRARLERRGLLVVVRVAVALIVVVFFVLAPVVRPRSVVVVARLVGIGAAGVVAFAVVLAREIAGGRRVGRGRRIGEITPEIVGPRALGSSS